MRGDVVAALPGYARGLAFYGRFAFVRLSKIRDCMNIEGVVRQLPLFEPSIDPALLVRARAAGVDLRSALNDINAGLPHYRFVFMLQKALELCAEVRSLGAALLRRCLRSGPRQPAGRRVRSGPIGIAPPRRKCRDAGRAGSIATQLNLIGQAVGGRDDPEAVRVERLGERLAQDRLVVDDEDRAGHRSTG